MRMAARDGKSQPYCRYPFANQPAPKIQLGDFSLGAGQNAAPGVPHARVDRVAETIVHAM